MAHPKSKSKSKSKSSKTFHKLVRVNGKMVEVGGDQRKLVEIGNPVKGGFSKLVTKKKALEMHEAENKKRARARKKK